MREESVGSRIPEVGGIGGGRGTGGERRECRKQNSQGGGDRRREGLGRWEEREQEAGLIGFHCNDLFCANLKLPS